jgi:hypothetical protein
MKVKPTGVKDESYEPSIADLINERERKGSHISP